MEVDDEADALVGLLAEHLDDLVPFAVERMLVAVPVYRTAVDPDELRAACRAHLVQLMGVLADRSERVGSVPEVFGAVPEAEGRLRALEGVPLSSVIRAYQAVAFYLWEVMAGVVNSGEGSPAAAMLLGSRAWRCLDGFLGAMTVGYRDELELQIRSHEQRRSALVQGLLEGGIATPELWEAADLLRLPHRGPYVVIAARVLEAGQHALPTIERALGGLGIGSAWRLMHDMEIGVAGLSRPLDQIDRLVDELAAGAIDRVGISPPYDDLSATAQALRLARIALDGAVDPLKVVVFGRDPLAAAAASAPEVMPRLARAILAGLDDMPQADRERLLATFGVWLDNGGSADEVATRMYVHPNTVRYRLKRLEERTGRSLSDPRHVTELSLAFEVHRQQGDAARFA